MSGMELGRYEPPIDRYSAGEPWYEGPDAKVNPSTKSDGWFGAARKPVPAEEETHPQARIFVEGETTQPPEEDFSDDSIVEHMHKRAGLPQED